jgi:tRNA-specific 2-thiouridylase
MTATRQTVIVAMSGGVDSSVAAALLVEQGYRVIGITMKTFCYTEHNSTGKTCCGLDGIVDARRVAGTLGIPHYVFDMEEAFTADVIDDFVSEYAVGRTPNPCVRCNSNTKIPDLLRRGERFGAQLIATGHYARTACAPRGGVMLRRGTDRNKDQSYFLWGVPRSAVERLCFPVGALTKADVRARARALGLVTADKPESQEICFVPSGDYVELLGTRLGADHPSLQQGALVRSDGTVLGEHSGYARYTVGQRRGLGGGFREPLYVLGVRPERREVVVGAAHELFRDEVTLGDLNWIGEAPAVGDEVEVQLRHRAAATAADVTRFDGSELALRLRQPQRAVTPGQSGAVYLGDTLLGGGRIR